MVGLVRMCVILWILSCHLLSQRRSPPLAFSSSSGRFFSIWDWEELRAVGNFGWLVYCYVLRHLVMEIEPPLPLVPVQSQYVVSQKYSTLNVVISVVSWVQRNTIQLPIVISLLLFELRLHHNLLDDSWKWIWF